MRGPTPSHPPRRSRDETTLDAAQAGAVPHAGGCDGRRAARGRSGQEAGEDLPRDGARRRQRQPHDGVDHRQLHQQQLGHARSARVPGEPAGRGTRGGGRHAARRGRHDAHRRHRDPQQLQQADGRARPAVHVAQLRPRAQGPRRQGRGDAGGRAREARPQGPRLAGQLGLPQRHHDQEGSEEGRGPEGAQDPHDPDADLRRGAERDGRVCDADGVRRGVHVAADRRARRLRAFVGGRLHRQVLRSGEVHHADGAPGSDPR